MPVTVLHLITELAVGGAQVALLNFLRSLDRQRFAPQVACYYNGNAAVARQIQALDIPVHDLGMRSKAQVAAFYRLYRLLHTQRPQILHTWMFHANIPGRLLGRFAGVPVIISSEHTLGQEGQARRTLDRLTAPLADRVICISDAIAGFARQQIGIAPEKLVVIPNGIDLEKFAGLPNQAEARRRYHLPAEGLILAAVGRPRPVKGYPDLVRAFHLLAQDFPAACLLFVGDGPGRPALEALAASLGLAGRVIFLGDQDNIPEILAACDLLALPSLHEGMGIVALEAMAAGLPVVGTHVGGIPEAVQDGVTGLLVPPQQPPALATAIRRLLEDGDLRRQMGAAGRQRVLNFSLARTVQQTQQLYETLLKEKQP